MAHPIFFMSLTLWRYQQLLHTPLQMKYGPLRWREGLFIQYESIDYNGWGEIAPYPGLSTETLEDCLNWFKHQSNPLEPTTAPPPAVAWGLAMATGQLRSQINTHHTALPLNALLTEREPSLLRQIAHARYTEGYRCFKLKIGSDTLQIEQQRIQALIEATGPDIRLRLDTNRNWKLSTALRFAAFLQPLHQQGLLEYLEEPLQELQDISPFFQETGLPLALDESLQQLEATSLPWDSISGLILKPMALGPKATFFWVQMAQKYKKHITFSSVFESELGLRWLAFLAQSLAPNQAAGLDTWRAFASAESSPPLPIQSGKLFLDVQMLDKPPLSTLEKIQY